MSLDSTIKSVAETLHTPAFIVAAFYIGRQLSKAEEHVKKAERELTALMTRHMPAIHRGFDRVEESLTILLTRTERL